MILFLFSLLNVFACISQLSCEGGNQMSVIPCKLCVKLLSWLVCVTTIFAAAAISLEFEDDTTQDTTKQANGNNAH